jgi:3-methyladenine DNA glycosylase Mpg
LAIEASFDGQGMTASSSRVRLFARSEAWRSVEVEATPRVGISKAREWPWSFVARRDERARAEGRSAHRGAVAEGLEGS